MSPIRALFWKEWHQMQWRWIFSLTMCCLFVLVGLKTRVMPDKEIVVINFCGCAFLLPLFIAMGLVAEEREQGSLGMQLKLPIAARKVYIVKMAMGALAVIVPTILSMIIALIMAGNREFTSYRIIRIYGFAIPLGIVFIQWIVVLSMKRKTQWAAALTGMVIMAVWVFLLICDDMFVNSIGGDRWNFSLMITPFGFLEAASKDNGSWLATSIAQSILSIILFWWGMKRFSMLTRSGR
jgi:ABC-type transport system involved in multi-copper enzyme maturation permease subunit